MLTEYFLPLLGFCAITLFTPGPNNVMLMASGANFGFRRTVPHMVGIGLGHGFLVFIVGLGAGRVVSTPARPAHGDDRGRLCLFVVARLEDCPCRRPAGSQR